MGPRTIITKGAQTIPNFLIMQMERWNTIHRLPDDMQTGVMHCNIGKNHMILYRNVDHKWFYEAKTNEQLLHELLAVSL